MKVLCIGLPKNKKGRNSKLPYIIEVGEYYHVTEVIQFSDCIGYMLAEDPNSSYAAKYFAPVSDIDETEMIREYNKELV